MTRAGDVPTWAKISIHVPEFENEVDGSVVVVPTAARFALLIEAKTFRTRASKRVVLTKPRGNPCFEINREYFPQRFGSQ